MFLFLLMVAAFSIAGSAAFFSVTGLANTFNGTYWSAVVMGGSLEYGKLVATSYLYRYWAQTHFLLKSSLLILIIALMIITSVGVFGYLSAGYQSDSIPLKQTEQKITLIDTEKARLIERKQQIDNQIASLPTNTVKGRVALMKGFKDEQTQLSQQINALETEEMELKTKVIQTEAHVGPIIYIAKSLNLPTDDATKYLIYLLIFVFDPMALSLTLAFNVAIKLNEKSDPIPEEVIIDEPIPQVEEYIEELAPDDHIIKELQIEHVDEQEAVNNHPIILELEPIQDDIPFEKDSDKSDEDVWVLADGTKIKPVEFSSFDIREPKTELENIISNYHYYKARLDRGETLTQDENWQYLSIKDKLQKQGFNVYL